MTQSRNYSRKTPLYSVMPDADARTIMEAVFRLMREVGIQFDPEPEIMRMFSDAGCDVSPEGIVKFPTDLIKRCLDSTGRSIRIWNRPATEYIELSAQHTFFSASTTSINDTGLGLALCRLAVEFLGGNIKLESDPGKGSCFTSTLPEALASDER